MGGAAAATHCCCTAQNALPRLPARQCKGNKGERGSKEGRKRQRGAPVAHDGSSTAVEEGSLGRAGGQHPRGGLAASVAVVCESQRVGLVGSAQRVRVGFSLSGVNFGGAGEASGVFSRSALPQKPRRSAMRQQQSAGSTYRRAAGCCHSRSSRECGASQSCAQSRAAKSKGGRRPEMQQRVSMGVRGGRWLLLSPQQDQGGGSLGRQAGRTKRQRAGQGNCTLPRKIYSPPTSPPAPP